LRDEFDRQVHRQMLGVGEGVEACWKEALGRALPKVKQERAGFRLALTMLRHGVRMPIGVILP
jgi:hypothetical protein